MDIMYTYSREKNMMKFWPVLVTHFRSVSFNSVARGLELDKESDIPTVESQIGTKLR